MNKWDERFLDLAFTISKWSKDPDVQVGCVIVDQNNRIISTGYNGLPAKVADNQNVLHNKAAKNNMTIHAERNAIIFAKQNLINCTLYTSLMPCAPCAAMIVQTGIIKVVTCRLDNDKLKWRFDLSHKMFKEAEIELIKEFYEN
tara:strand:- start:1246 stop:1677 length:432 start_codon:yes stop_codon:yes gene_type:complete